jgi:hypothetical protein
VNVTGSQEDPVVAVKLVGIGFRDTAAAIFRPHLAPTGGDWAASLLYLTNIRVRFSCRSSKKGSHLTGRCLSRMVPTGLSFHVLVLQAKWAEQYVPLPSTPNLPNMLDRRSIVTPRSLPTGRLGLRSAGPRSHGLTTPASTWVGTTAAQ